MFKVLGVYNVDIRFNLAQCKCRQPVECTFGRCKNKFRILSLRGGGIRLRKLKKIPDLIQGRLKWILNTDTIKVHTLFVDFTVF